MSLVCDHGTFHIGIKLVPVYQSCNHTTNLDNKGVTLSYGYNTPHKPFHHVKVVTARKGQPHLTALWCTQYKKFRSWNVIKILTQHSWSAARITRHISPWRKHFFGPMKTCVYPMKPWWFLVNQSLIIVCTKQHRKLVLDSTCRRMAASTIIAEDYWKMLNHASMYIYYIRDKRKYILDRDGNIMYAN